MPVLLVHQSAELYGSDKMLIEVVRALRTELGMECIVILPTVGPLISALENFGAEVHVMDVLKISRSLFTPRGLWRLLSTWRDACKALDAVVSNRRIVAVHSNTIAVFLGAAWSLQRKVPHLWHVHEIIRRPRLVGWALRFIAKALSNQVIAASPAVAEWLNDGLITRHMAEAVNVENGVDVPGIQQVSEQTQTAENRPVLRIGLIGRINRWKGHLLLVEACKELVAAPGLPPFLIEIVGDCPPGDEAPLRALKQRVMDHNLTDRVLIKPFSSDVAGIYRSLDLCCVPSTEPEPFGLVAIEAMAHGIPVVAADWGGLKRIVEDGVTGLKFTPCSPSSLAEKLKVLLLNPSLRQAIGRAARQRYEQIYSAHAFHGRLCRAYRTLLEPNAH